MSTKLRQLKNLIASNKQVAENYFFMTVLQVLNSLFYLLIYPFLIRVLGAENYGLYVFAVSVVTYFIYLIGFGFDMPAVKSIAQNNSNRTIKSDTLSSVLSAKLYLEGISILIFIILLFTIPIFKANRVLFSICFLQTLSSLFFPQWYFQGVQRMRIVTFIQLFFKIMSLPFIFLLIENSEDIWIFALIVSLSGVFGALVSLFIIRFKDKLKIRIVSPLKVFDWYKVAFPFFLSSSAGIVKEQSITVLIGVFLSMRDVALFDLANKIIMVPRTLMMSVNGAIFPKLIIEAKKHVVRKIIRYETIVGLLIITSIASFGRWVILFMGGSTMLSSYPLAVILSFTVLVWLVVGAYISFVFIPQNKYYFITKNQIIAMASFFIICAIGLSIIKSVYILAVSIALSGLIEIFYCKYLVKKHQML